MPNVFDRKKIPLAPAAFPSQAHHLIPVAAVTPTAGTQAAIKRAYSKLLNKSFDINSSRNGINLPTDIVDSAVLQVALHIGAGEGLHPTYTALIKSEFQGLVRKYDVNITKTIKATRKSADKKAIEKSFAKMLV